MKRYLLFLFLLTLTSEYSFSQLTFHGDINGTTTWNSYDYIYIDGNVNVNGTLNIYPRTSGNNPVHVVVTGPYIISIYGALNVYGTSSRNIFFTADRDADQVYGESGEVWGNLSFDAPNGISQINYAVIEYGNGDSYGAGGGIDIYGDGVTVRNTTIRNCSVPSGGYGGGIYAQPDSPTGITLENLTLYNNVASGPGDGIYIASSCSVKNSVIRNHTSGEGVYFGSGGSLINCDIVNNATGVISSSSSPVIVNTIFWGNVNQVSGSPTIAYSGVQGGYSGTGNVNLSATNGDDTGPNFVNPSSPDLHIGSWITPLVDNGTASYSGLTIPTTDMDGNARLSTTDIGAYEFFYYIWTGNVSSSWSLSGNWTGSPSSIPTSFSENKVVIPEGCDYYPIGVPDLSLSSRSRLEIAPTAALAVDGTTTVNSGCRFLIRSDATGSGSFISGTSVSGSFNVQMYLASGSWHYVATPVDGIGKSVLTTNIGNNYNLLNYNESAVSTDMSTGWNWHDTYGGTPGFSVLNSSRGYSVYTSLASQTAEFTGTILGNGDFIYTNSMLSCGTGPSSQAGWNLIGNPFTAGVDANNFDFGTNVIPWLYFIENGTYVNYNPVLELGTTDNLVPALQGFFIHATNGNDKTLTIPSSSRIILPRTLYKGSKSYIYPVLKLNVSDGSEFEDIALIYFLKDATIGFDDNYDAYKFLSQNLSLPQIYTTVSDTKLSVNGLPYPDKKTIVPLKIRVGENKNYTIKVLDLENLGDYSVTLSHGDKKVDLKTSPSYSFSATAGTINDMEVIFENISTDINVPLEDNTSCWYSDGLIKIKTTMGGFENNSSVVIHDMNGKVIYNKNNVNISRGEIIEFPVNLSNGIYIIAVSKDGLRVTDKIVIAN